MVDRSPGDHRPRVRVCSGARLHFGLLDTHAPFGGVGTMIDHPQTCVEVTAAAEFDPGDTEPQRLTAIAQRLSTGCLGAGAADPLPPCRLRVVSLAPTHSGLGSGTQLALAAATALATHFGLSLTRADLVTKLADRGRRSAIGSIGFFEGGLIAEDGLVGDCLSPSHWQRLELPADWRVVLARPAYFEQPVCGEAEGSAFALLPRAPQPISEQLRRLASDIMAAVTRTDFAAFASTLTRFNCLSGELFAAQQGGCYNGTAVTELIEQVKQAGGTGYGQSSWGPIVFAFCPSHAAAKTLADRLGPRTLAIAAPRAAGAEILVDPQC